MNERVGTELSAAARQVIADARGADDPSAEDEARVKARWLAGIAAGAGVSSLSEAVRAAASTGWGLKAAALAAALAAATAGVYLGWPQHVETAREAPAPKVMPAAPVVSAQPEAMPPGEVPPPAEVPSAAEALPAEPESAAPAAAATAEAEVAPALPSEAVAPEPRLTARAPTAPPRARPAAATHRGAPVMAAPVAAAPAVSPAAPLPSGQLGEEISLISEIRGQLQAGAPSRALEQLAEYRRRFEQPNLAMEADALRVDALCQAGEREAARAAAAAFASNWPASPLQQRVSAACP